MAKVVITFRGTKSEAAARLKRIGPMLAGKITDPTGMVEQMKVDVALDLMGKIHDAYVLKSGGGTDEMGITWPPLAATTLALRQKGHGTQRDILSRLGRMAAGLPKYRQRLIRRQYLSLRSVYEANALGSTAGRAARRFARRLTHIMGRHLPAGRVKKLLGELREQKPARSKKLAGLGSFAMILRVTGDLLNSLSPTFAGRSALRSAPGSIFITSNKRTRNGLHLLTLHNSDKPRKKKKDGTDRLPRRQVLPDVAHPIPERWKRDMAKVMEDRLTDPRFLLAVLGSKASGG
jgi:hypothetical protein